MMVYRVGVWWRGRGGGSGVELWWWWLIGENRARKVYVLKLIYKVCVCFGFLDTSVIA